MKSLILICLFLAACGGPSSNNSSTNTPEPNTRIGNQFVQSGDNYSSNVNGKEFKTKTIFLFSGQPILIPDVEGSERKAYLAINGQYVEGFAASYSAVNGQIADFSFYGLQGAPMINKPIGTVNLMGVYMLANASTPAAAQFAYEAKFIIDYDQGTINGETVNFILPQEATSFNGQLSGNSVNLTIIDQFGTHIATGALYGPNGEELAAGFNEGVLTGLIYGAVQ